MKRRGFIASCGAAAAACAAPGLVTAQARVVKVIFPSTAGGTGDAIFRVMEEPLRAAFGTPFIIDYKPGAGGMTGTLEVARGPKDGSVIGFAFSGPMSTIPILRPEIGFDPRKDVVPVVQLTRLYSVIIAPPSLPVNDIAGLIEYAKSKPQGLNMANSGAGGVSHIAAVQLANRSQMNMTHVAYKGVSDVYRAVMAGEVDVGIGAASAQLLSFAKEGKMKFIAVTSPTATSLVPGVAPVAKDFPGFVNEIAYGIITPVGTPQELVTRLNAGFVKVLSDEGVQSRFLSNFCIAAPGTPAMYAKTIASEYELSDTVIKRNGIKLA